MKTFSRSNRSIDASVTSPCTSSGMPVSCIASSVFAHFARSVTPWSEFVVAPAGYSFTPCTKPLSRARRISSGGVLSVRYSVISGSNVIPAGSAAKDALAIGLRLRGGRHRRLQVRHDDGAAELARGVRQHGGQHVAVAQVKVPVVGTGERERRRGGSVRGSHRRRREERAGHRRAGTRVRGPTTANRNTGLRPAESAFTAQKPVIC